METLDLIRQLDESDSELGLNCRGVVFDLTPNSSDPSALWLTNATVFDDQEYIVVSQFGSFPGSNRTGEVFLTRDEIANLAKVAASGLLVKKPGSEG